jgi:hypothetical protein
MLELYGPALIAPASGVIWKKPVENAQVVRLLSRVDCPVKIARSRLDPAISSLTRMDQTYFGSSGFFWPISNLPFQSAGFYPLDVPKWERPPPSRPPSLDREQYRLGGLVP